MSILLSACIATLIAGAGWLLLHFSMSEVIHGPWDVVGLVLQFPGVIVASLFATFFVSGGIHSIGEVFWMMPPISWIVYFLSFVWFFHRRRKRLARQRGI